MLTSTSPPTIAQIAFLEPLMIDQTSPDATLDGGSTAPVKPAGQDMWGGRFSSRPAEIMQAINVSIGVDRRLWAQDLAGSRAHCRMLAKQGVIAQADADAILGGLDAVEAEITGGTFPFRDKFEDIHMNVEARLN